ncbi:MAG: hypothetical protein AAGH90_07620 [Pseudomonadota bacterium]
MRGFAIFALLGVMVCGCHAQGSDQAPLNGPALDASEFNKFQGVYAGSYICAFGENGLTVSLDTFSDLVGLDEKKARVDGRLWFYDVASNKGHPTGAFRLSGTIEESGMIEMTPGEWLSEIPDNWGAAGIGGQITGDATSLKLTGRPTGPGTQACETFTIYALPDL